MKKKSIKEIESLTCYETRQSNSAKAVDPYPDGLDSTEDPINHSQNRTRNYDSESIRRKSMGKYRMELYITLICNKK